MPAPLPVLSAEPRHHAGLVRPLPGGPLDLVGDVHGQIDALADLLGHLGYDPDGDHPRGRRLVFLGDLVDRGPDSVGVVQWVMRLVGGGKAHCILGNHELSLLRGREAPHNAWFFGDQSGQGSSAGLAQSQRDEFLAFMRGLPLAMDRDDLRAVHACWHEPSIDLLRQESDAVVVHDDHRKRIDAMLGRAGVKNKWARDLAHQNENPVKMISSGPECPADPPFLANGKVRELARVPWWDDYLDEPFCVFGHYWRDAPADFQNGPNLFKRYRPHQMLGAGSAICIDYSVGARGMANGITRLAALRWPERVLVFDDGSVEAIEDATALRC